VRASGLRTLGLVSRKSRPLWRKKSKGSNGASKSEFRRGDEVRISLPPAGVWWNLIFGTNRQ